MRYGYPSALTYDVLILWQHSPWIMGIVYFETGEKMSDQASLYERLGGYDAI